MEIKIDVIEVEGRLFKKIETLNGFVLAQEVVEVVPRFEKSYMTLSDQYCLLNNSCVIAESDTREFKMLEKALESFKGA